MSLSIDLNCDLGEYDLLTDVTNDAAIMAYISSCNVACGGHAGNQQVIDQTIALAFANQVQVGAHPSYPDKANFGRQVMNFESIELKGIIKDQIMLVKLSAESQNGTLTHVKPHGALYNQAAQDYQLSVLLIETVAELDSNLMFYGMADSATELAAKDVGLKFVPEGFADRSYTATGSLVSRANANAVISSSDLVLERAIEMVKFGTITALTGELVKQSIMTLCIHGDHVNAAATAKILNDGLQQAGVMIKAPLHKS